MFKSMEALFNRSRQAYCADWQGASVVLTMLVRPETVFISFHYLAHDLTFCLPAANLLFFMYRITCLRSSITES